MTDGDSLDGIRNLDIPDTLPALQQLREFILRNPVPDGPVDAEYTEQVANELRVRGGDAIVEAVQRLRERLDPPNDE